MRELTLKRCPNCGALVKIIKDCNCHDCKNGISCCDTSMKNVQANTTDAAVEKHKPIYKFNGDVLEVSVNHVMEEEHYIEWLCLLTDTTEEYIYFKPGDIPKATFNKVTSGKIYSYCNKHSLWVTDIE